MKTVCELNKCVGCMACLDICKVNAIKIVDSLYAYNAVIDEKKCLNCNACDKICQVNRRVDLIVPTKWQQGFSSDKTMRLKSASGGLAASIMRKFIMDGGYVCSCLFDKGKFTFKLTKNVDDVRLFQGSKYVKSDPSGIYSKIKEALKNTKVLFIGLPCQVAALKLFIGNSFKENLFTIDLICHGTPSPQLLMKFLRQYSIELSDCSQIYFRKKADEDIRGRRCFSPDEQQDLYSIAFLQGIDYTDGCYECNYAQINRVGDITLGDSWGSRLNLVDKTFGVSLIICNTEKANYLLSGNDLQLYDVDVKKALSENHQLNHPMVKHYNRPKFFKILNQTDFNTAVRKCLFKDYIKQIVKRYLINIKLFHRGGYRLSCLLNHKGYE